MGITEIVFELLVLKANIKNVCNMYIVAMVTMYGKKNSQNFDQLWAMEHLLYTITVTANDLKC